MWRLLCLTTVASAVVPRDRVHAFVYNPTEMPIMLSNATLSACNETCEPHVILPGRILRRESLLGETLYLWRTPEKIHQEISVDPLWMTDTGECAAPLVSCGRPPFSAYDRVVEADAVALHNGEPAPADLFYVNTDEGCEEWLATIPAWETHHLQSLLHHRFRARETGGARRCIWEGAFTPHVVVERWVVVTQPKAFSAE